VRLVVDTCVVLWAGLAPERLSLAARDALVDPAAEILVASITAAEIACAQARGRVSLNDHWRPWFRRALAANGWIVVSASLDIMEEAYSLPEVFHPDPTDRIIVATARIERAVLVTGDRLLLAYPHVDTLW